MSLIFELPISNLGYMEIFTKIGEKILTHFPRHFFFKTFLSNRGKNEDEDGKIRENNSSFEFSI